MTESAVGALKFKDVESRYKLFATLIDEIDGHKFNPTGGSWHCRHESHRGDSMICWRASVYEFLENQTCGAEMSFKIGEDDVRVTCSSARHDNYRDHQGSFILPGDGRTGTISWRTNNSEGGDDG